MRRRKKSTDAIFADEVCFFHETNVVEDVAMFPSAYFNTLENPTIFQDPEHLSLLATKYRSMAVHRELEQAVLKHLVTGQHSRLLEQFRGRADAWTLAPTLLGSGHDTVRAVVSCRGTHPKRVCPSQLLT